MFHLLYNEPHVSLAVVPISTYIQNSLSWHVPHPSTPPNGQGGGDHSLYNSEILVIAVIYVYNAVVALLLL